MIIFLACLAWGNNYYLNTRASNKPHRGSNYYWNTVDSVNNYRCFNPGDSILIARGCTCSTKTPAPRGPFEGVLAPKGSGDNKPGRGHGRIVIAAYTDVHNRSTALPVINGCGQDSTAGIMLFNQQYWTIENLEVKNLAGNVTKDTTPGWRWGILVYSDTNATLHNIAIIGNTVDSVYGSCYPPLGEPWPPDNATVGGIIVWASGGVQGGVAEARNAMSDRPDSGRDGTISTTLMDSIMILRNLVRNNRGVGIRFYGAGGDNGLWRSGWDNLCTRVRIGNNCVLHTAGEGILAGGTNNDIVDSNKVVGAGKYGLRLHGTGPFAEVGIQVYRHINGIVEYNEVDSTQVVSGDGQAFDNDGSLSGTTIFQYNYSHDNQGGLFQDSPNRDDPGKADYSVFRYNISRNDGLGYPNDPGNYHMFFFTMRGGAQIYNNTLFNQPGGGFAAWTLRKGFAGNGPNVFRNNIFVGTDADWNEGSNTYSNNWYFCNDPQATPPFSRKLLSALPKSDKTPFGAGATEDPGLAGKSGVNRGFAVPLDFRVTPASGCRHAGLHIVHSGIKDFFGNPADTGKSIGADEE